MKKLEHLFGDTDNDDNYYKPVLVKTSFKYGYKYYESREDGGKELSLKQYIYMIMPYLSDLINDQIDTSLLADVFEKFRDPCIEIYGLDPSHFLSAPRLAWQASLKKQM